MKSCLRSSKDRMLEKLYRALPLHITLAAPFQKIDNLTVPLCFCSGFCHPLWRAHGCGVSTQNIFPLHPYSSAWTQRPTSNIPRRRLPTRVPPSRCAKKPCLQTSSCHMPCPEPLSPQVRRNPRPHTNLVSYVDSFARASLQPANPVFIAAPSES